VPLGALARAMKEREPDGLVLQAFLELQTPTLPEAVASAVAQGARHIRIVPVFWARAGHVARDLTPAVEALRAEFPQAEFVVLPVLSEMTGLIDFVADIIRRD
jgi:sirohydrochlorin cobaltochelatase